MCSCGRSEIVPGPDDGKWSADISTAKSLCASTLAFRPGSHVSDVTSASHVDVSGWEDVPSHHSGHTAVSELDRPILISPVMLYPRFSSETLINLLRAGKHAAGTL